MTTLATHFIEATRETFARQKSMGERAMAQLSDAQLHERPVDPARADTNPIAVIVRHLHGNMLSRWTDFLTTDGEKPTRTRDDEFDDDMAPRDELMRRWEEGWAAVFNAIDDLTPDDLTRDVRIRGEAHTVSRAILRQVDHYGYHTAQIVFIAKLLKGDAWETLTVPRGGTEAFNRSLGYQR